jgi:putative ABC transport system ATP-binding protein
VTEPLRTEPVAPAGADARAAVRVVDAVKIYGTGDTAVRALDGVSVEVPRGQFLAIMGPSGSGKSTLLHCAAALDRLTSGTIEIDGTPLEGLSDARLTRLRREQVGFVFQAYNLVPTLTARENITLPLDLAGEDVDAGWFDRIVDTLAIGDRLRHTPAELSGGQQQRVAAARALLGRPEVVIADEPTSSLDWDARESFLQLLMRECSAAGTTLVFVSHDVTLGRLFDRTVALGEINRAARTTAGAAA